MRKIIIGALLLGSFAGPAMAGVPGPSNEFGAGILGLTLAGGVAYLLSRRRNRS
jgi:LPXTG-motif cell wall-anchored protein